MPRRMAMPPRRGSGRRAVDHLPSGSGGSTVRFSAIVFPVTVISSRWSSPASSICMTTGTPPRGRGRACGSGRAACVGQVRHPGGDPVEVVELELDPGLVGDGEQVQHRVGRAAERHGDGDRVLERALGEDVAGPDVRVEQLHDRLARRVRVVVAAAVDRGRRRGAGQRQAERLAHRRHRVRGEHPGARTDGRTGVVLDRVELLGVDRPRGEGAHGLEDRDDVERLAFELTGSFDPAVEEHARQVDTGRGHHHAGQRLVAPRERHQRVEALRVHHGLDRVGDHLRGDEAAPHALVAHGDAVGHGDGVELDREPTRRPHPVLGPLGQPDERHVAGRDLVPRRATPTCDLSQSSSVMPMARSMARAGARWTRRSPRGCGA